MKKYKRIFTIVIDSFGAGEMPDAAQYGDEGTDTMGHISQNVDEFTIPNLQKLGIDVYKRQAQFAPFAALTGHDAAIKETARLTDERLELSEEAIAQLNERINIIRNNIGIEQKVSITYFIPDAKKAGGSYVTCSGIRCV